MALTLTSDLLNEAAERLGLGSVASSYPLTAPRHKTGTRMLTLQSGDRWAMKFDDDPEGDGEGWRRELVGWQRARHAGIPAASEVRVLAPEEPWKCGLVAVKHVQGVTGDAILNANSHILSTGLVQAAKALAAWHRTSPTAQDQRFPPYDDHFVSPGKFGESLSRRISQVAHAGFISETLRGRLIHFVDQSLSYARLDEPTPIHYDATIANMLFDRATGRLMALLDFEMLSRGPALYDLVPMYGAMACGYYTQNRFVDEPGWHTFWRTYAGRTEFTPERRIEITLYAIDALFHARFVPDYWYGTFTTILLDGVRGA